MNYYAILPMNVRRSKELPSQAKLLYAEISSMVDENNLAEIPQQILLDVFDIDLFTLERWISLLEKGHFIHAEKVVDNNSVLWKVSLLFPERIMLKPEQETLGVNKKETEIELTPEQILQQHYDMAEIQKSFPSLDIANHELPVWSAKLCLKYGKKRIKDPKLLYNHFIKWISKSNYANNSENILEVL